MLQIFLQKGRRKIKHFEKKNLRDDAIKKKRKLSIYISENKEEMMLQKFNAIMENTEKSPKRRRRKI